MLNIVIPMAGLGSRFAQAGFTDPKPFISIKGLPMIELVIGNLRPAFEHRFIFICLQEHLDRYGFENRLRLLAPGCEVIGLPGVTEGAACSVLEASRFIDNEMPLMVANSDQWVDVDINAYLATMEERHLDGLIMTFASDNPKWSYVLRDSNDYVCEVVEKKVVSAEATVGIYNFRHGRDFCRCAREMISRNERSMGEFYVAPVYTHMYQQGNSKIDTWLIDQRMHGLGTPADLSDFLSSDVLERALGRKRAEA